MVSETDADCLWAGLEREKLVACDRDDACASGRHWAEGSDALLPSSGLRAVFVIAALSVTSTPLPP